jgi:hypothetical protein
MQNILVRDAVEPSGRPVACCWNDYAFRPAAGKGHVQMNPRQDRNRHPDPAPVPHGWGAQPRPTVFALPPKSVPNALENGRPTYIPHVEGAISEQFFGGALVGGQESWGASFSTSRSVSCSQAFKSFLALR